MKIQNKLKLQFVLLILATGLSVSAADFNNEVIERTLYGDSVLPVKEKTIRLFGDKDTSKKTQKKSKIQVEHIDNSNNIEQQALTDAEYIKALKKADKKRIRNDKFEINVTRSSENDEFKEEESLSSSEDIVIQNPSDKKFFAKNKKKKAQKENKQSFNSSVSLTADETNYNPETNEIEAVGNAKFEISGQDFVLYGDKIIFSYDTNSVKAYQNVKIIKEENVTTGDFIFIDLSTACGWIQSPVTSNYSVSVKAKEAYVYSDKIQENDGVIKILEDRKIEAVGSGYSNTINNITLEVGDSYLNNPEPTSLKFKVKEIEVTPKKEHNEITMKSVSVYYKKLKLAVLPEIKLKSNKNGAAMQANFTEIGGDTIMGMFIGPSYVAELPFASTLKISPLLMYDTDRDRIGVGGLLKFMNETNSTEAGYGTAKENFLLRGSQKITDNLSLIYSQNAYVSEWFMGSRRPDYGASLLYQDRYFIEDLGAHFEHRLSLGAYADYKNSSFSKYGEGRARWMGQLNKDIFSYKNRSNDFAAAGGLGLQGMISQYTSGDTFALGRVYPYLSTTFKNWSQYVAYFQTGVGGSTPFIFDDYFYGKSSLQFIEGIKINKYLSLGYVAVLSLGGRDSYYNGDRRNDKIDDLFQENQILVSIGPDEAKFTLGYDIKRQSTKFYYTMMLGSKDMDIKFDKAVINDPMSLADNSEENTFLAKMRRLKYKVFPATNPNFNRETDLYPQIPANEDGLIESEIDEYDEREFNQQLMQSPLNQFYQQQELMRDDRM